MTVALLLLAACAPVGYLHATQEALPPAMEVTPSILDFGSLGADDIAVEGVTVSNVGGTALNIESVALSGSDGDFWIYEPVHPFGLAQDERELVLIAYSPLHAYEQGAELTVTPHTEGVEPGVVELLGIGLIADVELEPTEAELGEVLVGCTGQTEIQVQNVGTESVTVMDVGFSSSAFGLAEQPELPWDIAPGDEPLVLTVEVTPDEEAALGASIEITTDSVDNPVVGMVTASGVYVEAVSDVWQVAAAQAPQGQFELTATPVEATLSVQVNAVEHSDWTYADDLNTIILETDPAEAGDEVRIDYARMPDSC